ncbi:MAG: hypothetical protein MNPFHGCM_02173 [Gemmatimonadaceae bacterium]|nr:hypothetical protein [Gemmatimonadaceae bacterium]
MPRSVTRAALSLTMLILAGAIACSVVEDTQIGTQDAPKGGAAFTGDSTSDSTLTAFARGVRYDLLPESPYAYSDIQGDAGRIDLCIGAWATSISYADLQDGNWRRIGCVIRSGVASVDFPYVESGLSFAIVRRSAGNWQIKLTSYPGPSTIQPLFVSVADTDGSLGPDARLFLQGSGPIRPYVCFTCDRKACCVKGVSVSDTQAQIDLEDIAENWS